MSVDLLPRFCLPHPWLQIYNHVASGFSDANPYLRELTLKSLAVLGPKLSQKTLNQSLLKHLAKLQVGPLGGKPLWVEPRSFFVTNCGPCNMLDGTTACIYWCTCFSRFPLFACPAVISSCPLCLPLCPHFQVDEEASIRANTTVLLGNLASHLSGECGPSSRSTRSARQAARLTGCPLADALFPSLAYSLELSLQI